MKAKSVRFVEGNTFAQTSHLESCKQVGRCIWGMWSLGYQAPGSWEMPVPKKCSPSAAVRRSASNLLLGCLALQLRLDTNGTAMGKGSALHEMLLPIKSCFERCFLINGML